MSAASATLSPVLVALARADVQRMRAAFIYGSRTRASQVLATERSDWRGKLTSFEVFDHPSAENERAGTPLSCLDEALTAQGGAPDYALVCGPEAMMLTTAKALHDKGVPRERIFVSLERRMHCGVGVCGHCYVAQTYVCKQGPTYRFDELLALQAKSPAREPTLAAIHHC